MEGNVSLCRAPFTSAKISEWHLQKVVLEPLQLGAPVPDIVAESAVSVLFFSGFKWRFSHVRIFNTNLCSRW